MKKYLILILLIMIATGLAEKRKEINLNGTCRFRIGDKSEYAQASYPDMNWKTIQVPADWENEGYPGYDGFAWYRIHTRIPSKLKGSDLALMIGRIDDADQVYLNGHYIGGKGEFPPVFITAYNEWREYYIPPEYIRWNQDNIVAIRVYDESMNGGILEGDLGIYSILQAVPLEINLAGLWKFKTGDDQLYKNPDLNDISWKELLVPAMWDGQGYKDYDGWAWYRKSFILPDHLPDDDYILAVGMIDDMDETYFNGELIGHTGQFTPQEMGNQQNDYWNQIRYYYIPPHLIRKNSPNTIAVRVYDVWKDGGIYQGPIGILSQQSYLEYQKKSKPNDFLIHLLDEIFKNEN